MKIKRLKSPSGDIPGREAVVRQNAADLMDEEVPRWAVAVRSSSVTDRFTPACWYLWHGDACQWYAVREGLGTDLEKRFPKNKEAAACAKV